MQLQTAASGDVRLNGGHPGCGLYFDRAEFFMEKKHPSLRIILPIVISGALVAGVVAYGYFRAYDGYETKTEADLSDAARTEYCAFGDTVVGVSRDGISAYDYDGNLQWTSSFEMDDPQFVIRKDAMMVYDLGGTEIAVFDRKGKARSISANLPVIRADLSDKGTVGAVMTDEGTHVINVYGTDGKVLAGGELHTEKTGYPVAVAISRDGLKLAVSIIDMSVGSVKTTLRFYDFSGKTSEKKDFVAADYSYSDMIIPSVTWFDDGKVAAFGDNEVMVFTTAGQPREAVKLFIKDEIRSVLTSGKRFALITGPKAKDDGSAGDGKQKITLYAENGGERFSKTLGMTYTKAAFLSNGEIFVSDGEEARLYTEGGVRKFSYRFENGLSALLPWDGSTNYIIVADGKLKKVQLK